MRKFILAMALAAMSCGLLNAETIAEGKALHPTATFYYCKEKKWDGIPKMSSVERFAWKGLDVWIKFYDQDDEMSSRLNGHVETEGDWTIIPFKSGKVAVNFQEENSSTSAQAVISWESSTLISRNQLRQSSMGSNQKLRYRISEVADMLGVPASTIKYWTDTFEEVQPVAIGTGRQVRYRNEDIETLRLIKVLMHDKKMQIVGAKEHLRGALPPSYKRRCVSSEEATAILSNIKHLIKDNPKVISLLDSVLEWLKTDPASNVG